MISLDSAGGSEEDGLQEGGNDVDRDERVPRERIEEGGDPGCEREEVDVVQREVLGPAHHLAVGGKI
jgi:hypothetical protein